MISILFAAAVGVTGPAVCYHPLGCSTSVQAGAPVDLFAAHRLLAAECFRNGMARGRLTESNRLLGIMGIQVLPESRRLLALPIPEGCRP